MSKLSHEQIGLEIASLPGWSREGETIRRSYQFSSFSAAMGFVNQVAQLAETADHHPDIDIRYNRVVLTLTSHDSGGVTARDVRMAKALQGLEKSDMKAAG